MDFSPGTGYLRQDLSAGFQDVIRTEDPFRTPHNETFLVGVQRALWPDLAMSLTYVHRDIRDILGLRLTNLAFESRTVGAPITTDGGPLQRTYGSFYDGKYDGFIVAIDKRFRNRYQVQANYTYSKATDNLLNSNLGMGIATQGFNVTNARNPRLVDTAYIAGQPGPSFGQILVPLPGREIQLGLRLRF